MGHPTEGVLRRLLDEPAAVAATDRDHVTACDACRAALERARSEAMDVAALLEVPDDVDVVAGWQRLSTAAAVGATGTTIHGRPNRLRGILSRPAIAGAAVAVILAGAGTAAANDWLPIFRTEAVAPVSISTGDLNALPDLRGYGEVRVIAQPDVRPVADAKSAARQSGLDAPEVAELPRGVTGEPRYQVGGEAVVEFTFSAERAARTAAAAGETLPPVPAGLDGSRVRLVAGPGVAAIWSKQGGSPVLVVGRAVAPSALASSGVPFEVMRDYLLSLPGLPEAIASSLRTFNADGSTLPLPVPADYVTTSSAEVDGLPATVLVTRDRSTAAVVWVDDGVMTVVAGALDSDEVLAVAGGLG
jgi:hypothetical protein